MAGGGGLLRFACGLGVDFHGCVYVTRKQALSIYDSASFALFCVWCALVGVVRVLPFAQHR